jgi:hypothetical protein
VHIDASAPLAPPPPLHSLAPCILAVRVVFHLRVRAFPRGGIEYLHLACALHRAVNPVLVCAPFFETALFVSRSFFHIVAANFLVLVGGCRHLHADTPPTQAFLSVTAPPHILGQAPMDTPRTATLSEEMRRTHLDSPTFGHLPVNSPEGYIEPRVQHDSSRIDRCPSLDDSISLMRGKSFFKRQKLESSTRMRSSSASDRQQSDESAVWTVLHHCMVPLTSPSRFFFLPPLAPSALSRLA